MKVGIIGSGGREHAICLSVWKSKKVSEIYCIPGNAGTTQIAKNLDIDIRNFDKIKDGLDSRKYSGDGSPRKTSFQQAITEKIGIFSIVFFDIFILSNFN